MYAETSDTCDHISDIFEHENYKKILPSLPGKNWLKKIDIKFNQSFSEEVNPTLKVN